MATECCAHTAAGNPADPAFRRVLWAALAGVAPEPYAMGAIAVLALATNLCVAVMLYTYRNGDANMRSVWLCTRNDVIGNIAVLAAALGVLGTGTAWPDLAVATLMAVLALSAALTVTRHSLRELAHVHAHTHGVPGHRHAE